jgi:drug/metabolite transporter (DMT)-like permease
VHGGNERVTLAAFVAGSVLAGGNGVAIRFSNRELDPLWGATLRFVLAALPLLLLARVLRLALPRGRALAGAVAFGLLQFAATFALLYYALVELHAGFTQIILALVPLLALGLAVAEREERFRAGALLGGVLAVVGVAVLSGAALPSPLPLLALLAALGAAVCFAQAAVLVRILPPVHPVAMNAVGMSSGAAALFVLAVLAGDEIALPRKAATWEAVAYVALFGSIAVFLLYLFVLGRWEASRASYSFVLIPIVAIVLSAWLDDEPVGLGLVLGGALVLCGVYVGALRAPTRIRSPD